MPRTLVGSFAFIRHSEQRNHEVLWALELK